MNLDLTVNTLRQKAGCITKDSWENINRYGLYMFTHVLTGESYVGKAERQPLCSRLIQHLNIAMSDRQLTGKFDPFLREHPQMKEWHLQILAMEQDQVAEAERIAIKRLKPNLNVQLR